MSWVRALVRRWLRLPAPPPVEDQWRERVRLRAKHQDLQRRRARLEAIVEMRLRGEGL